jgi:hypothetical protein
MQNMGILPGFPSSFIMGIPEADCSGDYYREVPLMTDIDSLPLTGLVTGFQTITAKTVS